MCTEDGELPPFPLIRGGADSFGEMTLVASDGVESSAFYAHPNAPSNRGVVILPDFRGLSEFYTDLAIRFAEAGLHAITIDYYTREIGRTGRPSTDDRDYYTAQLQAMDKDAVDLEAKAAVEWLRSLPGVEMESVFTVGFCCGGTFAWNQAATDVALNGFVSFYGVTGWLEDSRIAKMHGPMLMMIAEKDFTPVDKVEELAAKVRENGATVETHVYDGAPHGFFSRTSEFEDHCADAWTRMLDFFERNSLAATH